MPNYHTLICSFLNKDEMERVPANDVDYCVRLLGSLQRSLWPLLHILLNYIDTCLNQQGHHSCFYKLYSQFTRSFFFFLLQFGHCSGFGTQNVGSSGIHFPWILFEYSHFFLDHHGCGWKPRRGEACRVLPATMDSGGCWQTHLCQGSETSSAQLL